MNDDFIERLLKSFNGDENLFFDLLLESGFDDGILYIKLKELFDRIDSSGEKGEVEQKIKKLLLSDLCKGESNLRNFDIVFNGALEFYRLNLSTNQREETSKKMPKYLFLILFVWVEDLIRHANNKSNKMSDRENATQMYNKYFPLLTRNENMDTATEGYISCLTHTIGRMLEKESKEIYDNKANFRILEKNLETKTVKRDLVLDVSYLEESGEKPIKLKDVLRRNENSKYTKNPTYPQENSTHFEGKNEDSSYDSDSDEEVEKSDDSK